MLCPERPAKIPTKSAAILDRFLHHAEIITFQGRSFRLKNAHAEHDHHQPAKPKPASAPTGNQRDSHARTTDQTVTN